MPACFLTCRHIYFRRLFLKFLNFLLTLGSFFPLFILMAIFLNNLFIYFITFVLAITPIILVFLRVKIAKNNKELRELTLGPVKPKCVGFNVVLDLFFCYIKFLFSFLGFRYYHVFKVQPVNDKSKFKKQAWFLITKRQAVSEWDKITAYRIFDNIYIENLVLETFVSNNNSNLHFFTLSGEKQ